MSSLVTGRIEFTVGYQWEHAEAPLWAKIACIAGLTPNRVEVYYPASVRNDDAEGPPYPRQYIGEWSGNIGPQKVIERFVEASEKLDRHKFEPLRTRVAYRGRDAFYLGTMPEKYREFSTRLGVPNQRCELLPNLCATYGLVGWRDISGSNRGATDVRLMKRFVSQATVAKADLYAAMCDLMDRQPIGTNVDEWIFVRDDGVGGLEDDEIAITCK